MIIGIKGSTKVQKNHVDILMVVQINIAQHHTTQYQHNTTSSKYSKNTAQHHTIQYQYSATQYNRIPIQSNIIQHSTNRAQHHTIQYQYCAT